MSADQPWLNDPVKGTDAAPWLKDKPVGTKAPTAPEPSYSPSEGMGPLDKLLVGAGAAFDRAKRALTPALPDTDASGRLVESQAQRDAAQGKDDAALYQKHHPGGWATAGEIGADVAMGAIPVARGGQVLTRALAGLGRAAPLVADVAANAGYAAATAPEDRGTAAAFGGGGAAVGRGLGRVATGLVRPTDEAANLIQKGVRLTPGQAAGKGSMLNDIEQKMGSHPIAGWPINAARTRALEDANQAVAQAVVNHVDDSVKLGRPPAEAIEQVRDRIGEVYDEVLPRMRWPVENVQSLARHITNNVGDEYALVSGKQRQALSNYFGRRMGEDLAGDFDVVPGEYLKQVDSELGSYARQLAKSTSAEEKAAAPMWYDAQRQWRENAMQQAASSPEDFAKLNSANAAYRQLLAVEKALRSSGGERVNPRPLAKALEAAGIKEGELADLSRNMSATLPGTVSDSGTAGRLAMALMPTMIGGAAGYGTDDMAAGAAIGTLLGSRVGSRALTGQMATQRKLVDLLRSRGMTKPQAEEAVKQVASQAGRSMFLQGR